MSVDLVTLEDVISHDLFPEVDAALRRGRHIDRSDDAWYYFLTESQGHLEAFYRRYGCEFVGRSDGFFFLVSTTGLLGKRMLSAGEMVVGQALALLYLSPSSVQQAGLISREQLLSHLTGILTLPTLIRVLTPQRRRVDERVAEQEVRDKVMTAARRLAALGFVDLVGEQIRLRAPLARFIDPVRSAMGTLEESLTKLIANNQASMAASDAETETAAEEEP